MIFEKFKQWVLAHYDDVSSDLPPALDGYKIFRIGMQYYSVKKASIPEEFRRLFEADTGANECSG